MYWLYILECSDRTLYSGITTDLNRRVSEHNSSNLGSRYTRSRRPVKLVFSKALADRSIASKEEARVKKMTREAKLKLLSIT